MGGAQKQGASPLPHGHTLAASAPDPPVIGADNATLSFSFLALKWELQYLLHRPSGLPLNLGLLVSSQLMFSVRIKCDN